MGKKYIVSLTSPEREPLQGVISKGSNASKIRRAYVLLGADASADGKQMTDEAIHQAYNVSIRTIERLRQQFVEEGFERALNRKVVDPTPRKIDGDVEAHLIAMYCGQAPNGYTDWSLHLLAGQMVELNYVESISHETVRQVLKKTNLSPTKS